MTSGDGPIGYGRPPARTRFKPGVSGNPDGRPKRKPSALADIIRDTMNASVRIREHGRTKTVSRKEAAVQMLVRRAVAGDIASAYEILKARSQAKRDGEMGVEALRVLNWLPDEEETAEQKNQNFERSKHVAAKR